VRLAVARFQFPSPFEFPARDDSGGTDGIGDGLLKCLAVFPGARFTLSVLGGTGRFQLSVTVESRFVTNRRATPTL